MRHWRTLVACVLITSVAIRLVPGLSYRQPYGFDIYDLMSRVVPALTAGKFKTDLPQGPLLDHLLSEFAILGGASLETISSFLAPSVLALSVLPAIIYTKKAFKDEPAAIVSGLLAATTNVIVHQTGGTVVWEGLGTLFAGFALTLLIQTNLKDPKVIALLCMTVVGTLVSHHLTTMNVLLGLGVAALFLTARRGIRSREAYKPILLTILLGVAALSVWTFVIPRYTIEVIGLTAANANVWTLLGGGALAATAILASYRAVTAKRARDLWTTRPFTLGVLVFAASVAMPLLLHYSGGINAEILMTTLFLGVPMCVVYVPLFVIGLTSAINGRIDGRLLTFVLAFPTACCSLTIFLIFQPGLGVLAYREVSFMLYSLLPIEGLGLMEVVRKGTPARRYIAAFIIAYSILALASTSYPPRSYLMGLDETYRPSDLRISEIAVNAILSTSPIDTDIRIGNVILYLSGREVNWVSNVTYWTSPGPAWLGKSAAAGRPLDIPSNVSFIIFSETMLKSNGGVVVDLLSRRLYPLPDEALVYLERKPGVSRIADAGTALIFQVMRRQDEAAPPKTKP